MSKRTKEDMVYRVARTRDELEEAFSLVYKEYDRRGYIPRFYTYKLRMTLFNALPSTTTFVAMQNNAVAATVTLVSDSSMGILMDRLFQDEVDKLRQKGRRVAEVSQLAVDSRLFPPGWFSMFNFNKLMFIFKLFKLVLDYARFNEKLNDLCIAFNPRHKALYSFLEFERISRLKYYGSFHSPAIAVRLNLDNIEEKGKNRKGIYNIFFGKDTPQSAFDKKYIMTADDLEYFFVEKSNMLKKAHKDRIECIRSFYPQDKFNRVLSSSRR